MLSQSSVGKCIACQPKLKDLARFDKIEIAPQQYPISILILRILPIYCSEGESLSEGKKKSSDRNTSDRRLSMGVELAQWLPSSYLS